MIFRTAHALRLCMAALLALGTFTIHAQDTVDDGTKAVEDAMKSVNDATKAAEQDAKDVLGDRANPPDLSHDTPPASVQKSDNAGSANFSTHSESHSETVTERSSSGSSIGFGDDQRDRTPRAGEIANNPPPPPGWPGHDGANRPAGDVMRINAGPIWNNDDAKGKCPDVCGRNQLNWTGDWRTTGANQSECDCSRAARGGRETETAAGPGTYCEAPANHQCRGCSVHCPSGKQAYCQQGDRGIFTEPQSAICTHDAVCECR